MPSASFCHRVGTVLLAVLLLASGRVGSATADHVERDAFTEGGLHVLIDGTPVEFDPAPYILPPGRTMVPMRAMFESLGADVAWNGATQTVTGTRGGRTIRLTIGSHTAHVNDLDTVLEIAPEIRNGRTFVPLRFVAESLDSTVGYAAALGEISIWSRTTAIDPLRLPKGTRIRVRPMLVNLFLSDPWDLVIGDAAPFPGPVTYTFVGRLGSEQMPLVKRTLVHLGESRQFLPTLLSAAEGETAPWVSAQVYQDLRTRGGAERFVTSGLMPESQRETSLLLVGTAHLVFTLFGKRVQVAALVTSTLGGDRFWILDDPENPLVLKFQPVGLPQAGTFGAIGYQIEAIGT